jgi:hypothetical protein
MDGSVRARLKPPAPFTGIVFMASRGSFRLTSITRARKHAIKGVASAQTQQAMNGSAPPHSQSTMNNVAPCVVEERCGSAPSATW